MVKIKVSKEGKTALAYLMILEEYSKIQKSNLDKEIQTLIQSMDNDEKNIFLEGLYEIKKAGFIKSDIELEEIEEDNLFEAVSKYDELDFEVQYITETGKDYFDKLMKLKKGTLEAKDRIFEKIDKEDIEAICAKINDSQWFKTLTVGIIPAGNFLLKFIDMFKH